MQRESRPQKLVCWRSGAKPIRYSAHVRRNTVKWSQAGHGIMIFLRDCMFWACNRGRETLAVPIHINSKVGVGKNPKQQRTGTGEKSLFLFQYSSCSL